MPFVSEAQRRLMYAAAAGKKTKTDISQKAAKKLVAEDEPGRLPEKVSKAEDDGSDMAKQLLAQINELSQKLEQMVNSDKELEDWVDSKIVSAKKDLEDIAGYLTHNEDTQKSIHGSENTPDRIVATVDGIAKADDEMSDYEKKAQGALDFKNQMKQFRREHGSTIMDIAGGRKIDKARADAYHAARGNLMIGHGVSRADIPPKIPATLIHNPITATPVEPPALPMAKSMESLVNPKSLLAKVDSCLKCMRKNLQKNDEFDGDKAAHDKHIADSSSYAYRHRYKNTAANLAWNKAFDQAKAGKIRLAGEGDYHPNGIGPEYVIPHPEYGEIAVSAYDHNGKELFPESDFRPSHKEILQEMENPTRMQFWNPEPEEAGQNPSLEKSSKKKSKPFHGYNKKKHARSGGLNDSYRKKVNRETGSNLKRPVTKKNVKPGSKAAKRRKSFCARMSGVKGPTSKKGKLTPKGAALKRWRCSKSLNKSESVPLELRAQRVLKSLLDKSNSIKPFGENIYDSVKNIGRKMNRTGYVQEGAGKNVAVQQTKLTANQQAAITAKEDEKKNKKQPVAMFSLENVPQEHRQAVYDAYMSKTPHPLMHLAVKIKPNNRKKAVVPKELLPPKEKKPRKNKKQEQSVILGEEDLKASFGARSLGGLIKGDVIDLASKKKEKEQTKLLPKDPLKPFGFHGTPEAKQAMIENLESRMARQRERNNPFAPKLKLAPSIEEQAQQTQMPENAPSGSLFALKRPAFGNEVFQKFPREEARDLISDWGIEALGLTEHYSDAAQQLHESNLEDQGFSWDSDKGSYVDEDGNEVDHEMYFPQDQEILDEMLDNGSHLFDWDAYEKNTQKSDHLSKAHEVLSKLEKKFSLKGALTAGAIGASALAGNAQASPESDLHSQLSNLNVMGEYHTPKGGSQAILKEPSQLKADPSHPSASYSREAGGSSAMGSFYGPDAAKAKQLLQNYDAVNKSFKKSTGIARKVTPEEMEERRIKKIAERGEYKPKEYKPTSTLPSEKPLSTILGYKTNGVLRRIHTLNNMDSSPEDLKHSLKSKLKGGKGDKKNISNFDPLETAKGKKVEMEHTKDPSIAEEISVDHLAEDPKYYSKLKAAGLADELSKAHEALSKLEKRCWKGYKPVKGKEPYSKGSCEPVNKAISAQDMESGKYQGEKLDANHHNRIGREYREMARKAKSANDMTRAKKYNSKSQYHFRMANQKGYTPPND